MLELPTQRLPWTAVAALMDNERFPLDYNRRWNIIVRNANDGRGPDFQHTSPTNSAGATGSSSSAEKDAENVRARRLELLEALLEG